MMEAGQTFVDVLVLDFTRKVLPKAKVTLTPLAKEMPEAVLLKFDQQKSVYHAEKIIPGEYVLLAEAYGLEPQQRQVVAPPSGLKETFILGKAGMPFYYKEHVKVPFEPLYDLLGVAVDPVQKRGVEKEFNDAVGKLGLEPEKISEDLLSQHVRVFRYIKSANDEERKAVQEQIDRHPFVRRSGPMISIDTRGLSFLTNEFIVRFKDGVPRDQILAIVRDFKLEVIREIPYIPNGFHLRALGAPNYAMLDICAALLEKGLVVYAEPNLVVTAIRNYTPNDPRFNQQPHHPLIHTEAAWDHTLGSSNILIAVMDDGCDTNHEDLTNPAGTGWTKVVHQFNFTTYNTTLDDSSHGTRSCGIATAVADNLLGVAGVAPGCQLLPCQWLASAPLSDWADAYIWMSGGNPGQPAPFPATLAKGADVISNSIGVGDFPMSGMMKDCWNYVTAYGRNGRGCVVVFAAGNYDDDIATDSMTQWANYEKTIAVASCTISPPDAVESKISTSSFGDAIDLCAPAGGPAGGTEARTMSTANGNTYATHGQTSCACPQVAGAAALVLSANPDLSWVEVRQILRDCANPIDTNNATADGIWHDVNGVAHGAPGYAGPHHSRFYGHGMLDAQGSVETAVGLVGGDVVAYIDTWIMENSADVGTVPCPPPPYSPDVWVRNLAPASDDPAHVTEHQSPIRNQDNWVYANVRNRGAQPSFDVYARIMITRWAGTQYVYPADFLPTINPSTLPTVMAPGTYLIGEVHIPTIPAHGMVTVNTRWVKELIPPATVTIGGTTYSWADSCLLVDISPHDGATPTGTHTWDNNNLCQRNITIVDAPAGGDDTFDVAFVIGHALNEVGLFHINIERKILPENIQLFFDYVDPRTTREAIAFLKEHKDYPISPVEDQKRILFKLPAQRNVLVPILRKKNKYQIVAVTGKGLKKLRNGLYQVNIYEEGGKRRMEGGINLIIKKHR